MSVEPLEAAEVRILRLQPGDEIVLKVGERHMDEDALRRLKATAEERWPGYRVTVLHSTIDMEIVRQ